MSSPVAPNFSDPDASETRNTTNPNMDTFRDCEMEDDTELVAKRGLQACKLEGFRYFKNLFYQTEDGVEEAPLDDFDLETLRCCETVLEEDIKTNLCPKCMAALGVCEADPPEEAQGQTKWKGKKKMPTESSSYRFELTAEREASDLVLIMRDLETARVRVRYAIFLKTGEQLDLATAMEYSWEAPSITESWFGAYLELSLRNTIFLCLVCYDRYHSLDLLITAIILAIKAFALVNRHNDHFSSIAADVEKMMWLKANHTGMDKDQAAATFTTQSLLAAQMNEEELSAESWTLISTSLADISPGFFERFRKPNSSCFICSALKFDQLMVLWMEAQRNPLLWKVKPENRYRHVGTLAALRLSAGLCDLCGVILEAITDSVYYSGSSQSEGLPISLTISALDVEKLNRGFTKLSVWLGDHEMTNLHIAVEEGALYQVILWWYLTLPRLRAF
jgi:hypothetical protein